MIRRVLLGTSLIILGFVTILIYLYSEITQTSTYNNSRAIDVQDSIHRQLENIALDELTVNMDEEMRKENVAVISNVGLVKANIKERFDMFIDANPDYKITKYQVVSPDSKIKGSYNSHSDKLSQTYEQLPEIAIDIEGEYVGTVSDFGNLPIIPFKFIVTIKTDFVPVTTGEDQRQNRTTNKNQSSEQGINYSFKDYKGNSSYQQEGQGFNSDGINFN